MKLNKFFSLLLVIFIFSYVSAFSDTWKIEIKKSGGGGTDYNGHAEKYADVYEVHDAETHYHGLNCSGDGNSTCAWTLCPSLGMYLPNNIYEDMFDYAEEQINNGTYSGTHWANFWYDNHYYSRSVTWSGMEIKNSNIYVDIMLIPD